MIYAVILLSLCIVFQQILHIRERKDLYNRIMSKDLGEYVAFQRPEPKTKLTLRANYFQRSMRQAYRTMYGQDKAE